MSSEKRREGSRATLGTAARIALALVFAGTAASAGAMTFYKWTDDRGQVHYGDAPPKAFAGSAKRIDVETPPHAAAKPRPPVAEAAVLPEPAAAPPDPLTQRRLTRARLEKNLEQARERLDLAQKALAETAGPQEGEQQVVQGKPLPDGSAVPNAGTGHANCTTSNGRTFCPHLVPNEQYYERVDRMQEEVRAAEQAVEEAELAYRRGVD